MPPSKPPSNRAPLVTPRKRRSWSTLGSALIVATLLHIPLLIALPFLLRANQESISSDLNNKRDFRLNMITEQTKLKEKERAEKKEKLRDEREGQFISMDAPEVEQTPDEARFLDQFASKAERQTVKKQNTLPKSKPTNPAPQRPERPTPQKPAPRPAESRPPAPKPERAPTPEPKQSPTPPDETSPKDEPENTPKTPLKPAEDGAFQAQPSEEFAPKSPAKPVSPGELFPTAQNTPQASGDGSYDYLSDVAEGDKTLLNRKRSRYWSFMQRLKEGVAKEWSPMEEYRRRDPRGKVYGVADRYTVLRVTLNGDGSLRTIYVAKSSGLEFYDDEAVRAMRAAAPFQNPPEGLKDSDGLIQLNFGLLLDLTRGTLRGFRIRRQ